MYGVCRSDNTGYRQTNCMSWLVAHLKSVNDIDYLSHHSRLSCSYQAFTGRRTKVFRLIRWHSTGLASEDSGAEGR